MKEPLEHPHGGEHWKPQGMYFAPDVRDIPGLLVGSTSLPEAKGKVLRERLKATTYRPFVRSTIDTSRILRIDEQSLIASYEKWATKNNSPKMNLLNQGPYNANPADYNRTVRDLKTDWTKFLRQHYDAVWVHNVDNMKGRSEIIALTPQTVKLFWKDKKWPIIAGASTLGAMEAYEAAQPEQSEAGVKQEALKLALGKAKKVGKQFFRTTEHPYEEIVKFKPSKEILSTELKGKYFTRDIKSIPALLEPDPPGYRVRTGELRTLPPILRGATLPGSKIKEFNQDSWKAFMKESARGTKWKKPLEEWMQQVDTQGRIGSWICPEDSLKGFGNYMTNRLKKEGYTHAVYPDYAAGQPDLYQTVVLKPGHTAVSYKGSVGLIGAAGAGLVGYETAQPEEPQAFPVGKWIKAGTKAAGKVITKEESRAAKPLVGQMLSGKRVANVTKGAGNWRYIVFDDGSVQPMTKDVVTDLSRATGTAKYMETFAGKQMAGETESVLAQASKSLEYHISRQNPYATRDAIRDHYKSYVRNMKDTDPSVMPNIVPVAYQKKFFYMPRNYAEVLKAEGKLEILSK